MNKKEFNFISQEGEGLKIEFKESFDKSIAKEMVAFANSEGGRIFLGFSDEGKLKGIKIDNKLRSKIQDVANNCDPIIKIGFEEFDNILIIKVKEGTDKPYKCSLGFYLRQGPNSQKMTRSEILDFFKSEGKVRFDELMNKRFKYPENFSRKRLSKFLELAGLSKTLPVRKILINLGIAETQGKNWLWNEKNEGYL